MLGADSAIQKSLTALGGWKCIFDSLTDQLNDWQKWLQVEGELVSRKRLEELAPEQFSSILILADESATFGTGSNVDMAADSDSRNLATLLLLRDLQTKRMGPQPLTRKSRSSEHKVRPSTFHHPS